MVTLWIVLPSAAVAVVVSLVMIHYSLVLSHFIHFLIYFVRCSVFSGGSVLSSIRGHEELVLCIF